MSAPGQGDPLPLWNLDPIFPGFDTPKHLDAKARLRASVSGLLAAIGDVRTRTARPAEWVTACIGQYNRSADLYEELSSYAYARYSTDTRDITAQREINQLEEEGLPLKNAIVRFRNALAELSPPLPELLRDTPDLAEYRFFLEEQLVLQRHQMDPAEEALAADLSRAGGDAWTRLHEAVSSTLTVVWDEKSGERKTVTQLRALAFDRDRSVRERAFRAEIAAWKTMEVPLAFALNGVKGFSVILNARRGWESTLERSVVQSRITAKTLESLIGVMQDSLPLFRRYLAAKATALRLPRLAFFDLFAPVGKALETWPFERSRDFIVEQLTRFSPEVGAFARSAFDAGWIDARPREGKVGGAYCTSFPLSRASRVLANYSNDFSSLTTIGHELGHAYHHEVLKDEPAAHRQYPMTLAETASIFSESLIYESALEVVSPDQQITILEDFLQGCTQVVVDILSRYLFESRLLDRRTAGELSPDELSELMLGAQRDTYGESLDGKELHPYMWAVKGHYYNHDFAFYNFPYAFGQLFGLGLYSLYRAEGPSFAKRYRSMLAETGKKDAVSLIRSVGFDIEQRDFWRQGVAMIAERVDRFAELVGAEK